LILPEGREIDGIWVELALEPISLFKNQMRRPPDTGDQHIGNYQTAEVENPYRYDILEALVANSL
jgi:hypothetical protein